MKQESRPSLAGNRRNFLKVAGLTGIGLTGAAVLGNKLALNEQKVEAASISDTDVINFALNLEYLEGEFYAVSTYGATLVQLGVITAMDETGPTTGGMRVPDFAKLPEAFLASALRDDEIKHITFLRSVLGSAAVKKPAINLNALGYGFANVNEWLKLARQFEDVGLSAYLGAINLISQSPYLPVAAAILATEAQHSGSIRDVCIANGVVSPAVDGFDIPPITSSPYYVDNNGLSIRRTASQVLNIVYAGGRSSGGFFPAGMNGAIASQ